MSYYFQFPSKHLSLYGLTGLRDRYVFTKSDRVRLRYPVSAASLVLIGILTLSFLVKSSGDSALDQMQSLAIGFPAQAALDQQVGDKNYQAFLSDTLKARISDSMRTAPAIIKKAKDVPYRNLSVGKGDTIAGVLKEAGISNNDAFYAVKAIGEHFDLRRVRSGQKLDVHFKALRDGSMGFDRLSMKLSPVKEIVVSKKSENKFTSEVLEKELERKVYGRMAKIETSLYGSAARADIPAQIIAEMIRIYSWNVDFQRDVRRGDKVEVLYEAFETDDGDFAKYGKILYANLNTGGREKPIYRFEMDNGRIDYFEPDGTSVRKTLMKTPVDGARISSGFGMRRHPILGYNKMHKGVDFAAPTGTPIYAAGDGVVEVAGRKGAYGNYMRIRHNSKLKTAYAHMSKFKKGMRAGKTVKQGDVIAYVGSTGRSTGPHLHYEVLVNGVQVNPRSVDLPTGEILTGQQLNRFKSFIRGIDSQYASLTKRFKFASFGDPDNS